jgi:hypothetical protein
VHSPESAFCQSNRSGVCELPPTRCLQSQLTLSESEIHSIRLLYCSNDEILQVVSLECLEVLGACNYQAVQPFSIGVAP